MSLKTNCFIMKKLSRISTCIWNVYLKKLLWGKVNAKIICVYVSFIINDAWGVFNCFGLSLCNMFQLALLIHFLNQILHGIILLSSLLRLNHIMIQLYILMSSNHFPIQMASGGYVDKVNGSTKWMPILLNQFCIHCFVITAFRISHIIFKHYTFRYFPS